MTILIRLKTHHRFFLILLVNSFFSCQNHDSATSQKNSTDSLAIYGQRIFNANCSSCHNFKQDGIGPRLAGIMRKDSVDWIKKFVRDPKAMIESGDVHAKNIQIKFHSIMPSFPALKEMEMDQLIAFLQKQNETPVEKEDSLAIKNPVPKKIAASNIRVELRQWLKMPATSDKEPITRISKLIKSPDNKWFINDQRGILYKIINNQPAIYLDLRKLKPKFIGEPGLATGFGSFVFHPDFSNNGLFYTTHCESAHTKPADFSIPDSINQTLQWVITEWKTKDPFSPVFDGTNRELLRIDMVTGMHGVQEITFNPLARSGEEDYGLLYIGVGDGGCVESGYSYLTNHPDNIWGTIIRIDPKGNNSRNGQYGIPGKNPFSKKTDKNIVKEIYAQGFRNPNHITWTDSGLMLATNIGQANIEALNIIVKGADYGWPKREGRFEMHPAGNINRIYNLPVNDSIYHITYPVAVFDHDEGNAIGGGFQYTATAIPALKGKFLFGDIPSGRLFYANVADLKIGRQAEVKEWFITKNGKGTTLRDLCGSDRADLRFAKDEKGEIYIFTKADGKIYRLVENMNQK
jgi:mono/diheme cytochrome c family protein